MSQASSNYSNTIPPVQLLRGREGYHQAIKQHLIPSLRAFNPSLILLSIGFNDERTNNSSSNSTSNSSSNIHPNNINICSSLGLQAEEDIAWATTEIMKIADICCGGRLVSVLEGGGSGGGGEVDEGPNNINNNNDNNMGDNQDNLVISEDNKNNSSSGSNSICNSIIRNKRNRNSINNISIESNYNDNSVNNTGINSTTTTTTTRTVNTTANSTNAATCAAAHVRRLIDPYGPTSHMPIQLLLPNTIATTTTTSSYNGNNNILGCSGSTVAAARFVLN